jgi:hypothetical protein
MTIRYSLDLRVLEQLPKEHLKPETLREFPYTTRYVFFLENGESELTWKMGKWKIPRQYMAFLTVEPLSGRLEPNSTVEMTCTFAPTSTQKWVSKLPCFYWHEEKGLCFM